jgi:hypothetical protein
MNRSETTDTIADDVRAMLVRKAADVPGDLRAPVPSPSIPTRADAPRRWLVPMAAAILVLAALAGLTALAAREDDRADLATVPPAALGPWLDGSGLGLPAGFDPATAPVLFTEAGTPEQVVAGYLAARFPDYPSPGVSFDAVTLDGGRAWTRWSTNEGGGVVIAAGDVLLRLDGDRWAVVAATTDGIDLADVRNDGARIEGTLTNATSQLVAADVLTLDGQPVAEAPRPSGRPGAAYRFGTAGDSDTGALRLDVTVDGTGAVLRVQLVGGTLLSISEAYLVSPAPPSDAGPPAPTGPSVTRVWPGAVVDPAIDRSTPGATAAAFSLDILREAPTLVTPDPDAPPDGPTWVTVELVGGATVRILTAPSGETAGYVVLQLGDGGPGVAVEPPPAHATLPDPPPRATTAEIVVQTTTGTQRAGLSDDEIRTRTITLDVDVRELTSLVVVWRGADGAVVGADGGHF